METITHLNFLDILLPLAVVIFMIGIGVVLLNRHFQRNLAIQKWKQEALKSNHQNDLLRSSIHAQEEERRRIAQDLHDELGSVISIMRMHLVMLEQQHAAGAESLLAGLHNARQLSETALASIRSISHQLMPPQLASFGLTETLGSVIEQINKTGKITIELNAPSPETDLSWIVNLALYRIVMELINNTIKHAGAKQVKIDILRDSQYIKCYYTDDGKGLPEKDKGKGLGHKSIEGRVSSLEGKLEWGNSAAGGFYALIQIPAGVQ
jgi:signal transduction histidine kinase